jgi:hypothetical protein
VFLTEISISAHNQRSQLNPPSLSGSLGLETSNQRSVVWTQALRKRKPRPTAEADEIKNYISSKFAGLQ